jgi:hypothetical protein
LCGKIVESSDEEEDEDYCEDKEGEIMLHIDVQYSENVLLAEAFRKCTYLFDSDIDPNTIHYHYRRYRDETRRSVICGALALLRSAPISCSYVTREFEFSHFDVGASCRVDIIQLDFGEGLGASIELK